MLPIERYLDRALTSSLFKYQPPTTMLAWMFLSMQECEAVRGLVVRLINLSGQLGDYCVVDLADRNPHLYSYLLQ